jgi:hypothetical protein
MGKCIETRKEKYNITKNSKMILLISILNIEIHSSCLIFSQVNDHEVNKNSM